MLMHAASDWLHARLLDGKELWRQKETKPHAT
jgi:hypothetical protein